MEQRRNAVVVLGMHRSGTSAMARVLSLAGAQLPTRLSGPYIGNPLGHWEPLDVADFNDKVLADLDTSWSDPLGPRQGRTKKLPLKRYISGAQEVIKKNYDSDFIVFKEPRSIILLDLWREALKNEGYELSYIVMVRHPNEVAHSLAARDKFIKNQSLLLWSTYMLASELGTRGSKRVFVKFDELIRDPEATLDRIETILGVEFHRRTWDSALEIEQFLSREERHHWDGDRSPGLEKFPEVGEFYSYLDAAARDEPWNIDASTRMAEWLNGLAQSVGPIFKQFERQLRQNEAELAAERETAAQARRGREQAMAELTEIQAKLESQIQQHESHVVAEREKAAQALYAHEQALTKLADMEAKLESQATNDELEREAADRTRQSHQQTLAELADVQAEFERRLKAKEAALAAEQEAADEARRAHERTVAALADVQAELERRLKENEAALAAEREATDDARKALERTVAELTDVRVAFERQLEGKEAELAAEQETAGEARRAHEQIRVEFANMQAEFERQNAQNQQALDAERQAASHLRQMKEQAEVQLTELRAELHQAHMKAGNAWQRATELEAGLAFARTQIDEKERDLDQRVADLQRAQDHISAAERQSTSARAEAAAREIELQNAVDAARAEVDAYRRQSEALANELIKVIGARREAPWRRFRIPFIRSSALPGSNWAG